MNDTLNEFCVPLDGQSDDGSGLSRRNQRSAREFRRLLLAALDHPVGADERGLLAVSGVNGTSYSIIVNGGANEAKAASGAFDNLVATVVAADADIP